MDLRGNFAVGKQKRTRKIGMGKERDGRDWRKQPELNFLLLPCYCYTIGSNVGEDSTVMKGLQQYRHVIHN